MLGIAQMQRGNRLADIGHAVQQHAESHGYGVVRDLVGHGVGTQDARGAPGAQFRPRRPGARAAARPVLAIEPMITEGACEVETLKDGWTVVTADGKLAAHFEHTIALTEEGPKILTLRDFLEHPDAERYRPKEEIAA